MRLNKKRLAALAMSAVMAASAMPANVLADEILSEEAATEAQVELAAAPEEVKITDITFTDGKAKVTYSNGKVEELTATKEKLTDATCTEGPKYAWTVTIDGKKYSGDAFVEGEALGHDYKKVETITVYPTCITTGTKVISEVCSRCEDVKEGSEYTETLSLVDHNWGETKVEYIDLDNVKPTTDGTAPTELVEPSKDGKYTVVTYRECKTTGCTEKDIISTEEKTIAATDVKVDYKLVRLAKDSNIVTDLNDMDPADVPEDADIELKDCTKEGVYYVDNFDVNDKLLFSEKVTVKAHHYQEVTAFAPKTDADAKMLAPVYDEKGNQTGYTNQSCKTTATYVKTVTCSATNCPLKDHVISKEEITVEPSSDAHVVNDAAKTAVEAAKADAKANKDCLTKAGYDALKAAADKANSGLKVVTTAACETEGTVTITYLCQECGKEIEGAAVTLKVEKLGHTYGENKVENKIDATCTTDGSYDIVHYCEVCNNREVVTSGAVEPATGHSYKEDGSGLGVSLTGTVVVDYDGYISKGDERVMTAGDYFIGYYKNLSAKLDIFDTCEKCGAKETLDASATVKVVDLKEEPGNGDPGYIVLNATYKTTINNKEKTFTTGNVRFNYFSNMIAYLERDTSKDPIDGLHQDSDGVFRYYQNNEFQSDFSGIVEYNGGEFFVANGVLCSGANGLNEFGGKWYFLAGGQIQRGYDGLALYDGEWFYLKNGELDPTVNGLVDYDGGTFLFSLGRLVKEHNGLWQDFDGTWYFLALGQVQSQYTGTAIYDGQTFELVDGKLVV